ncbi:hypothetical protein UPYG_G00243290 [Umbra pygmaea]|uniref:Uncharacterized protein n=1 Tax=Umbra pygmaea TaxID=75934 RepID=A0ABD0WFS9_UMBPY
MKWALVIAFRKLTVTSVFMLTSCCIMLVFWELNCDWSLVTLPRPWMKNDRKVWKRCEQQNIWSTHTNSSKNVSDLITEVTGLMHCDWERNTTEQNRHRALLHSCCNASGGLFLAQTNTHIGQHLIFEAERKKKYTLNQELYNMLPQSVPWNKGNLGHCAVVGNGGILLNSSCGAEIDKADFIIRLNIPPMNYSSDIGTKTHLVTINPSQIINSFRALAYARMPFVSRVSEFGPASLVLPMFSFTACQDPSLRALYTLMEGSPKTQVLLNHPDYMYCLASKWKRLKKRLSSGFIYTSIALELCQQVHLYGFWPFPLDLSHKPLPNHYYDNVGPVKNVHAMPQEFQLLLQLHRQGALQLHVGPCAH